MMIREGEIAFKINSHLATVETAQKIRKQIEYYLSLANLITDHFLRNIIKCSEGGWVKIQILTTFKQLNRIIDTQISEKLTNGQKKVIIIKSCEKSSFLQVNKLAIRRSNSKRGVKDFSNVLYCEEIDFSQFCSILQQNQVSQQEIFTQISSKWFFIEFVNKDAAIIEKITQSLLQKTKLLECVRIIKGNNFVQIQNKYLQIVGINSLQSSTRKSLERDFLKPNRIFSYAQIGEISQPKTAKIKKLRRKMNKSRLPRKYILANFQRKQQKKVKNTNLIHIQGCTPNRKKTSQEGKKYQQRKMEQRLRKKKDLKKQDQKMEIEKKPSNNAKGIINGE